MQVRLSKRKAHFFINEYVDQTESVFMEDGLICV